MTVRGQGLSVSRSRNHFMKNARLAIDYAFDLIFVRHNLSSNSVVNPICISDKTDQSKLVGLRNGFRAVLNDETRELIPSVNHVRTYAIGSLGLVSIKICY